MRFNSDSLRVSVIVCTYSLDMLSHLCDAINSLQNQTYDNIEIIVVIDGCQELCDRVKRMWSNEEMITLDCNVENRGLAASRNRGIELAEGDIIAFMDDDAVAMEHWIEELLTVYANREVAAVGGKMVPLWVAKKPEFLPEEFYWLVGVTHRGFPEEGPVRNTFGSNMSFRADVLDELGGFSEELGRKAKAPSQGEETELAVRLRSNLNRTFYYNPDAKVAHKVFADQLRVAWLIKRAFWQGYSKYRIEQRVPQALDVERDFFVKIFFVYGYQRLRQLTKTPSGTNVTQVFAVVMFTSIVGVGYLYGCLRGKTYSALQKQDRRNGLL